MTGLPEGEPQVGVVATNAAVHTAQIEVRLAQARIERSRLSRIPALTARASFGLAAGSTPVSVSLGLWWPVLDGGVRELDREALELELEDRRLSLELARTALAESLEDQVLEAAALRDRIRQADRAQADAAADHLRAEQLEQAGLWTERELARAAYGVTRQAALRRLLAMDVLAFDYRVRALRTAP
jgi:outer membrane protein TolC